MRRRGFSFGRQAANPNIPVALQHAHELMEGGNYAEAALAFEKLAAAAEQRMGPRAPFLFMQAGRARILLKQIPAGMAHLRHGLEKEASEIANLISNHIPAISESPTQRGPDPSRITLPTHCPSCGAAVRPNEIEWLDEFTAECDYCGSPVRGNS